MTPSREAIEAAARKIAAMKMGLEKDPDGLRLPDDLWRQALPQAEAALTAAYAPDFPQPSKSDEELWRDLCEKDDRTSPAEYPDMALISFDEFAAFRITYL